MLILIFILIVKQTKGNSFFLYLNSLFQFDYYHKKFSDKRRIEISEVFIFLSSLLGISFYCYTTTISNNFSILTYLQFVFLITFLLISKYLIEKIIGDLFEIDQFINKYLFYKQGILSWIGLFFLFPASLIMYLNSIDLSILNFIVIGISFLVYLIKLYSFFAIYQSYILTYWFYFILYLCAFEIAPYLILFKVFKIY